MASDGENAGFAPIRTQNILSGESEHPGYADDEVERPQTFRHESSTDIDDKERLERVQTSKSVRDRREFQPVIAGDREELRRIATTFSGRGALTRTNTATTGAMERQDTLAGVNIGDPVLDPDSPEFDVYKWTRM